ncbi:PhnE/PtxC family ABC transporter permease [Macrococcoides caseolyticum]|uniref:PhnE/PtxC family ABC transporter permease n=1 Tax=Macrococcoides caseolyticum TaxID=69966 RepID=UPI001F1DEE41|nr:ABC transporter permease subunit [Macrococcus caseolyticus]MCE4956006.1 ABC transporter permease subunit [Macrococcus caseolyticus]
MSQYVDTNSKGKIKITKLNRRNIATRGAVIFLSLFTVIGFMLLDYKGVDFKTAIPTTLENLKQMFLMPALSSTTFGDAFIQVMKTVSLAFLSTILGAVISLFLALGASKNLSNQWISNGIKVFIAVIRAVPTVLWVLIFAISAGLGSIAAVIGMMFHSIAYLVKAYSEAFEEVDNDTIEALKASGANWWHIVFSAVIPSTMSYLISWTFLRFEINFGVAVAMGAAAGAGGIGYELFMASAFYFDLNEVGMITYMVLVVAFILEFISTRLKNVGMNRG